VHLDGRCLRQSFAPIGFDIGADSSAEIAISELAEILGSQEKYVSGICEVRQANQASRLPSAAMGIKRLLQASYHGKMRWIVPGQKLMLDKWKRNEQQASRHCLYCDI
jgi:hypothetical protein